MDLSCAPRFRSKFSVLPAGGDAVFLVSERDTLVLRGAVYVRLAPLLDGTRSAQALIHKLPDLPPENVLYALDRLTDLGTLEQDRRRHPGDTPESRFWDLLESPEAPTGDAASHGTVQVVNLDGRGLFPKGIVEVALASAGLEVLPQEADPADAVALLICADYLDPLVGRWDLLLREQERSFMLVKPLGTTAWVGPILVPGKTACQECLADRMRAHRQMHALISRETEQPFPLPIPQAGLGSTTELALRLAATELMRWLKFGIGGDLTSTLLSFDFDSLELTKHRVVRRPQCARCGDPTLLSKRSTRPIQLRSHTKRFVADGGHRTKMPDETLRDLAHHISPLTGVVHELRRLDNPDWELIRSYTTSYNVALKARDPTELTRMRSMINGGKGMTDVQARASALCEAIERYSATFHGDEPTTEAPITALGEDAIHPNLYLQFSERQFSNRKRLNQRGGTDPRARISEVFDDRGLVDWTAVWSLTGDRVRYLPTACCYLGLERWRRVTGTGGFGIGDTSGAAAGNTFEEAILQGFLELVERDAVAIWWYNRLRRKRVDLADFDDPWFDLIAAQHRCLGRSLQVLDLTTDLEIPAFAAVSAADCGNGQQKVVLGFGAHLQAAMGVSRALAEVNQVLGSLGATAEAGELVDPATFLHLSATEETALGRDRYTDSTSDDLRDDVRRCVRVAERHGLETLILDLTRPDVGLPVVKVFVPGLRHYWPRLAPGRLYDVPVSMGWLTTPREETDLSEVPPCW